MVGRKKLCWLSDPADEAVRALLARLETTAAERDAMLKDVHLVEAALATDHTVVSLDDHAREAFASAAQSVGQLRMIAWVNPGNPAENILDWLRNGAEVEKERCLGERRR